MKIIIFFWFLFSLLACNKQDYPAPDNNPAGLDGISEWVSIHNNLAWKLLREEAEAQPHKNVLISPFSIHTALSMLLNGADSETLGEMLSVMGCDLCDVPSVNMQHQALSTWLTTENGHPDLTTANAFFYDNRRFRVNEGFQTRLEAYFDCFFRQENFDSPDQAKENINTWVKQQTFGKIDNIVDDITSDHLAFLINALHFKSDWSRGFDSLLTYDKYFVQSDSQKILTPFLFDVRSMYVHRDESFFIADIPFKDSTFSLSLIGSACEFPSEFDNQDYTELKKKMMYQSTGITFPKMTLTYKNSMKKSLQSLGMVKPFLPGEADFRNMGTSNRDVFIHDILHKSVLEVNENGAEGAAVTSIEFFSTELPPFFTFDRPYVVVLRHIPSETILFLAKVNEKPF